MSLASYVWGRQLGGERGRCIFIFLCVTLFSCNINILKSVLVYCVLRTRKWGVKKKLFCLNKNESSVRSLYCQASRSRSRRHMSGRHQRDECCLDAARWHHACSASAIRATAHLKPAISLWVHFRAQHASLCQQDLPCQRESILRAE